MKVETEHERTSQWLSHGAVITGSYTAPNRTLRQFVLLKWLPWWFSGKESACSAGDLGVIPRSGRSLGEGNGNPLQYSCLENPMDRGAWQATVHRVTKSQT